MQHSFDRTNPEQSARYFQHCVMNGDVDAALDCFDDAAVYIPVPGVYVTRREEIRAALANLCGMKPKLTPLRHAAFETGDIISWVDEWKLQGTLPDGSPLEARGVSSDVLKRQPDGTWKYLIDNPYGADYLDAMKPSP